MLRKSLPWAWALLICVAAFAACDSNEEQTTDGDGDAATEDGDTEGETADGDEDGDADAPPFDDPDAPGPYAVGAINETVAYDDPDVAGRTRELPCTVWYPAQTGGEAFRYDGWLVRDNVYADAEPDAGGAPYPLFAFSHGNSGIAEQSWTLVEYLVAHGFVVISCNHVGNTAGDWDVSTVAQAVHDRPLDVSAAISHALAKSEAADSRLFGLIDEARIAAGGHSLGGYTTLMVCGGSMHFQAYLTECAEDPSLHICDWLTDYDTSMVKDGAVGDPRVKAGVAYAPAGYGFFAADEPNGLEAIAIPMLIVGAERDGTCPMDSEVRPIYEALPGADKRLATLMNAAHMSFTDFCEMVGGSSEYFAEEGCAPGFATPAEAFAAMDRLTLAFLRRHLDGDARYDAYLTPVDQRPEYIAVIEGP
ncbi:MAG: hypothetical protein C4523_14650 [Myxococcales bacterium]|nr:MAG: hypothetical protein C4523_14650 [Myxococcales bacterium]